MRATRSTSVESFVRSWNCGTACQSAIGISWCRSSRSAGPAQTPARCGRSGGVVAVFRGKQGFRGGRARVSGGSERQNRPTAQGRAPATRVPPRSGFDFIFVTSLSFNCRAGSAGAYLQIVLSSRGPPSGTPVIRRLGEGRWRSSQPSQRLRLGPSLQCSRAGVRRTKAGWIASAPHSARRLTMTV